MSPRYSFSHDVSQTDDNNTNNTSSPIQYQPSPSDFHFKVHQIFDDHDSSSADELFSQGMIRPVQIKNQNYNISNVNFSNNHQIHQSQSQESWPIVIPQPLPPPTARDDHDLEAAEDQRHNSKSFWHFKRSSSLNCGASGYSKSLCPIAPLSRSNSTGSSPRVKRAQKPHSQKQSSLFVSSKTTQTTSSSSCSSSGSYSSTSYQKPPLKKSSYGAYGNSSNGLHVNPVLNVPSVNLFGFGSIFSNGKAKNKNKS